MAFELKGKSKDSKTVTVRLEADVHAALVAMANEQDMQPSEAVRQMIEHCLGE